MVQGSHVIHSTRMYNQEALHQFFSFWFTFKGGATQSAYIPTDGSQEQPYYRPRWASMY